MPGFSVPGRPQPPLCQGQGSSETLLWAFWPQQGIRRTGSSYYLPQSLEVEVHDQLPNTLCNVLRQPERAQTVLQPL